MVKKNPIADKHYEGTFAGGQGPIKGLECEYEEEFKGVHDPAPHLKTVGDGGSFPTTGREMSGFDVAGAGYRGPQNFTPTNLGVRNPDDIEKSDGVKHPSK